MTSVEADTFAAVMRPKQAKTQYHTVCMQLQGYSDHVIMCMQLQGYSDHVIMCMQLQGYSDHVWGPQCCHIISANGEMYRCRYIHVRMGLEKQAVQCKCLSFLRVCVQSPECGHRDTSPSQSTWSPRTCGDKATEREPGSPRLVARLLLESLLIPDLSRLLIEQFDNNYCLINQHYSQKMNFSIMDLIHHNTQLHVCVSVTVCDQNQVV